MASFIASHGTETTFVELNASVDGFKVILTAKGVEWCSRTGEVREEVLDRIAIVAT